jgi:hypothetical protein
MGRIIALSTHLAFLAAALLGAAAPARAGEDERLPRRADAVLATLAGAEAPELPDAPLPTRMDLQDEDSLWRAHQEDRDRGDRFALRRERPAPAKPILDFNRIEPGAFAGFVAYSGSFKTNPSLMVGVSARVPAPIIPGNWGAFGEIFVSHLNRDLEFFYDNQAGVWYGGAVGGDYTFVEGPIFSMRARAGILYANFNRIRGLDNGVGGLLGLQLSWNWVKHSDRMFVTISPDFSFDGTDFIIMANLGLSFNF